MVVALLAGRSSVTQAFGEQDLCTIGLLAESDDFHSVTRLACILPRSCKRIFSG
jgi:hypothetical protein